MKAIIPRTLQNPAFSDARHESQISYETGVNGARVIHDFAPKKTSRSKANSSRIKSLESSYQRAIVENNNKTELLGFVSHELKNQIGAILSLSSMMKEGVMGGVSEMQRECVSDIYSVANDMLEYVRDLMDVNQVESGNFSVDLTKKINIVEIIGKSIKINKDFALKRDIKIEFDNKIELPEFYLDSKRMKQILINLISNSLKYSKEGTVVNINAKVVSGELLISVKDHGFGMSGNDVARVFEKHTKINNENYGKFDSFGLGLPLVKKLTEMQNGIIKINSQLGKGTEAILRLAL